MANRNHIRSSIHSPIHSAMHSHIYIHIHSWSRSCLRTLSIALECVFAFNTPNALRVSLIKASQPQNVPHTKGDSLELCVRVCVCVRENHN